MSKTATLLLKLNEGWCDVPSLCQQFEWKPHTLRAAISGIRVYKDYIERRRENGVTSYRIAPRIIDDGQPSEMQEWQDYDRDC